MDKNTAEGTFSLFLGKYKSRQATVMLTRCSLPTETQTPVTGISKGFHLRTQGYKTQSVTNFNSFILI